MKRVSIVYAAPGAGLGHLMRAAAVCLGLKDRWIEARVVTNSMYAEGLARITGLNIDFIPSSVWREQVPVYVQTVKPRLVVLDTFPWGIRGEWSKLDHRPRPMFVLMARRLKIEAYLKAAGLEWDPTSPLLDRIIVAEPLDDDFWKLLHDSHGEIEVLPGRLRFPAERFPLPVTPSLAELLENGRLWLVVHTGPKSEIEELMTLARTDLAGGSGGRLAVILPETCPDLSVPNFEYFPAARLYESAYRVITGAGYNSLAEMARWPEKHLVRSFPRRYDDQVARLHGPATGTEDGTLPAIQTLIRWLDHCS